jgi:hypothetical protein
MQLSITSINNTLFEPSYTKKNVQRTRSVLARVTLVFKVDGWPYSPSGGYISFLYNDGTILDLIAKKRWKDGDVGFVQTMGYYEVVVVLGLFAALVSFNIQSKYYKSMVCWFTL